MVSEDTARSQQQHRRSGHRRLRIIAEGQHKGPAAHGVMQLLLFETRRTNF